MGAGSWTACLTPASITLATRLGEPNVLTSIPSSSEDRRGSSAPILPCSSLRHSYLHVLYIFFFSFFTFLCRSFTDFLHWLLEEFKVSSAGVVQSSDTQGGNLKVASSLTSAIHTRSFQILEGLPLRTPHPSHSKKIKSVRPDCSSLNPLSCDDPPPL